jgi:hypothetical protein
MVTSFLNSRFSAARADIGHRAALPYECPHAIRVEASTTGYMRTAKAPK